MEFKNVVDNVGMSFKKLIKAPQTDTNEISLYNKDNKLFIVDELGNEKEIVDKTVTDQLNAKIEEVKLSGIDFKTDVANAISSKGVPTLATDTKETFVNNISNIKTGGDGLQINGVSDLNVVYGENLTKGQILQLKNNINDFSLTSVTISNPINKTGKALAFSKDGKYMAVAQDGSSSLILYDIYNNFTKKEIQTGLASTVTILHINFSNDNQYLSLSLYDNPGILVYKIVNDEFIKITTPVINQRIFCTHFSNDNKYLAVAHFGSPFFEVYKFENEAFTKLEAAATLPKGQCHWVEFSPDGEYLTTASYVPTSGSVDSTIMIYKKEGDTFTEIPLAVKISKTARIATFDKTGNYLFVSYHEQPYVKTYKKIGDTFTEINMIDIAPTNIVYDISFSSDQKYVIMGQQVTDPYYFIYKWEGEKLTRVNDIIDNKKPTGSVYGARFSQNDKYLALISSASPYILVKELNTKTYAFKQNSLAFNNIAGLGVCIEDGLKDNEKTIKKIL